MLKGSCHCGVTQFEVTAAPERLTRCTCSFCHKHGALWAYYPADGFTLTSPRNRISTYQWNSFTMKHHHCAICGCTTFSEGPDWSTGEADWEKPRVSINAWLLDDLDASTLPVDVIDGKNGW